MSREVREIRAKYRIRFGIQAGMLLRGQIRRTLFNAQVFGLGSEVSYDSKDQAKLTFAEDKGFLDSMFSVTLEGNNKEVLKDCYNKFVVAFAKLNGATCE